MEKRRDAAEALREAQHLLSLLKGLQQVRHSYPEGHSYRELVESVLKDGGLEKAIATVQADVDHLEATLGFKFPPR
jgi:HEPN domain-containing protein